MIKDLEIKMEELQQKKSVIDKKFEEDCKGLEKQRKDLQNENTRISTQIKEKEKVKIFSLIHQINLNNI